MATQSLPDWWKIGKRIGKRLRDILNPPVKSPSKEELLAQRQRDSLKGLVYFNEFEEIRQWAKDDVDPVQLANTPLVERPLFCVSEQDRYFSKILLCHDYSGLLASGSLAHEFWTERLNRRIP